MQANRFFVGLLCAAVSSVALAVDMRESMRGERDGVVYEPIQREFVLSKQHRDFTMTGAPVVWFVTERPAKVVLLPAEEESLNAEAARQAWDALPKSRVFFAFDKDRPLGLGSLPEFIKEASGDRARVVVVGHADEVGSDEYNLDLSRRRAANVASWLEKRGVAKGRIDTVARGNADLLEPGNGAKNRRVEVIVYLNGYGDE